MYLIPGAHGGTNMRVTTDWEPACVSRLCDAREAVINLLAELFRVVADSLEPRTQLGDRPLTTEVVPASQHKPDDAVGQATVERQGRVVHALIPAARHNTRGQQQRETGINRRRVRRVVVTQRTA